MAIALLELMPVPILPGSIYHLHSVADKGVETPQSDIGDEKEVRD